MSRRPMSPPSPLRRRRRPSVLVAAGDLERLIAACDDALRTDPACLCALAVRGHASMKAKRWSQAVRDFSEILDARPDDERARFSRGMALFRSERVDEAHQDFSRVLELNPAHVMARFARAGCYNSEGEYNQAIQEYWLALWHDEESLRIDSHRRFGYPVAGELDFAPWSPGTVMSSVDPAGDYGQHSPHAMLSTAAAESTNARSSSCASVAAVLTQSPARLETRRPARKVVQVRVNLSQFALSTDPRGCIPASTSAVDDHGTISAECGKVAAKVAAVQTDSVVQRDSSRSAASTGSVASETEAPRPQTMPATAAPPARTASRVVRRVTVVL